MSVSTTASMSLSLEMGPRKNFFHLHDILFNFSAAVGNCLVEINELVVMTWSGLDESVKAGVVGDASSLSIAGRFLDPNLSLAFSLAGSLSGLNKLIR